MRLFVVSRRYSLQDRFNEARSWVCAFADSLQARLIVGRSGLLDDFAVSVMGRHVVGSHPVSLSRFLKHHTARLHSRDEWEPI